MRSVLRITLLFLVLFILPAYVTLLPIPVTNAQGPRSSFEVPHCCTESNGYSQDQADFVTKFGSRCNSGCKSVKTGGNNPAYHTGYDIPVTGEHMEVIGYTDDGRVVLAPFIDDPIIKGGAPKYDPIPTPGVIPYATESGTINASAIVANPDFLQTCEQVAAIKSCLDGEGGGCDGSNLLETKFWVGTFGPYTQTLPAGVTFNKVPTFQWDISVAPPSNAYSAYLTCNKTPPVASFTPGATVTVLKDITTEIIAGFGPMMPWFQVTGGGNTFGKVILSYMPVWSDPSPLFDKTASPQHPGIISVTEGLDLSDSWTGWGHSLISSNNQNTNNALASKDWYLFYSSRLQQAVVHPYTELGAKPEMLPDSSYTVYTTSQNTIKDLTITTPWVIGDGEKLIIIVDGILDIRAPVTITGSGFVAFVVKNDILIDYSVGTTYDSSAPVVEGMYIAGGSIKTGSPPPPPAVPDPLTARFVGKGMFAANEIIAQRDLLSLPHNEVSADLFIYNPAFLVRMPDILKDLSYTWQEVAP